MSNQEQFMLARHKIGKIIRATRKQLGLSQITVANALSLQQSALSRIESGKQELGACDLLSFSKLTKIPLESFSTGQVENLTSALLMNGEDNSGYRLPARYANARGSKVRAALPFLKFAENAFGPVKLNQYFKSKGIDPDFFVNLGNQININFCLDLSFELIAQGAIAAKDIHKIAEPVNEPIYHGILHHQYDHSTHSQALIESLFSNSNFYECNFKYELSDRRKNGIEISITPGEHIPGLLSGNHASAGHLLCQYKKYYFRRFTTYGDQRQLKLSEQACYFKGDSQCVYHIKTAA